MKTLEDQLAAAKRELAMRNQWYPRRVSDGRMSREKAMHEKECMEAIVETLQKLIDSQDLFKRLEKPGQPEWLSEALNSGDGSYKP